MDKYFRIKEKISSIQNPKIKQIIHLQKSNVRKRENTIFIEGFREISAAIKSDFKIETLYVCTEIVNNNSEILKNSFIFNNIVTIEITKEVFAKIAYRDNSDGLFAVAIPKYLQLNELKLRQNPLIIVLESVEKPGNIGAILRTSEAANVDAVIVCDSKTDIYNPNVIRSGLGCVFKLQVVTCTKEELQKYLKFNNISVYSTHLEGKKSYNLVDYTKGSAILMGTESTGLTDFWKTNSDELIIIPMLGEVNSLNVSVSAAIVLYEALRQRKFVV